MGHQRDLRAWKVGSDSQSSAYRRCVRLPGRPRVRGPGRLDEAPSTPVASRPRFARGSRPTSRFVPCSMVIGRSVLFRKVRQGTPRTVVSSWIPPESVRTSRASDSSFMKSR